ncbi:cell division/GTP binding protein [Hesseltinella vesiculosa]|uniref:Cell division/GTP binding protein n=1 Tax=Hesseltinella vesiculosa TaxID=101127 RepID=A0A1X2GSK0_9FUNG|nr:cell division/GTP binding protein [Hesseltinella vesiculosa]
MLYNAYSQKLAGSSRTRKEATSYLNVMVVGASGTGKTAFVRTFCERMKNQVIQGTFKESKPMVLKDTLRSTDELYSVSMHFEEDGQRTAFTIVDTPGFNKGFAMDQQLRYLAKYIDHQFERTLAEESKLKRDAKALDTHIHSCIYFLDVSQMIKQQNQVQGISDVDRYVIKLLSSRVNVIPVIGKADTLTILQREQLKRAFRRDIFDMHKIPLYGFIDVEDDDFEQDSPFPYPPPPEPMRNRLRGVLGAESLDKIIDMLQECVDEDDDDDARTMIDYLESMPLTVMSYEEDPDTGRPLQAPGSTASLLAIDDAGDDTPYPPSSPMSLPKRLAASNRVRSNSAFSKASLSRFYPWAVVDCCNPDHCDFEKLRSLLLQSHRDMLRIDTFERYYEQYRTDQLLSRKVDKMGILKSDEHNISLV